MKAIVHRRFGSADVLELVDVETPAVDDDAVLIRVVAASLNPLDWHYMTGKPYIMRLAGAGIRSPRRRIPGVDVAGRVESVGRSVTRFKPGDEVFGRAAGSLAEFVAAPEDTIVSKPADVTFEQAAATRLAALTALQALRDKGRIRPGQKVLINGASGGVGTCAVQIAKSFGAEVTGVCSTGNVEMVRSIGADHVVDYTQDDYTRGEPRYDLLFDNMGNHPPSANRSVIKPKGIYVLVGGPKKNRLLGPVPYLLRSVFVFMFAGQTAALLNTKDNEDDLRVLRGLLESGSLVPVIDRSYRLREAAAAFRHLETGHARGKIVITV